MRSSIRMALDSMPLSRNHATCSDHSGLQVFALTTLPLVHSEGAEIDPARLLAAREYAVTPDARRHRFVLRSDLKWSNGERLSAAQFAQRLRHVLHHSPMSFAKFWLRNVEQVSDDGETLTIHCKQPRPRLAQWLSMSLFSPSPPPRGDAQAACGRYVIREWSKSSIALEPNPGWPDHDASDPRPVSFVRVKKPQANVHMFEQMQLDVTADTAFPYELVPKSLDRKPDFFVTRPGVFAAITFEGPLQGPNAISVRKSILEHVNGVECSRRLGGVLLPCRSFERSIIRPLLPVAHPRTAELDARAACENISVTTSITPDRVSEGRRALRLAYDDYYPNREICRIVQQQLATAGISTTLVEDCYESPSQEAELRLKLFRGLRPGPLGIYYGLIFESVLWRHESARREFWNILCAVEQDLHLTQARLQAACRQLDDILRQIAAIVPLVEIPGLVLSRLATPARELFQPGQRVV